MYEPKRIILTKREGGEIQAALFSVASTREQEAAAYDLARSEGWMAHVFRPKATWALEDAVDTHHEIERYNHLRLHSGHVCPD